MDPGGTLPVGLVCAVGDDFKESEFGDMIKTSVFSGIIKESGFSGSQK